MKIPQTLKDIVVSLAPGTNLYKWSETGFNGNKNNQRDNNTMKYIHGYTEECNKPETLPLQAGFLTGFYTEFASLVVGLDYLNNEADLLAVGAIALTRFVSYKAAKKIGESEKEKCAAGVDSLQLVKRVAEYT